MTKFNNKFTILNILLISLVIRILFSIFYSDLELKNEWAILVHNLEVTGVLGLNVNIDDFYASPKFASPDEIVLPSVFMPPLYAYFIFILKVFTPDFLNYIKIIIFLQITLSLISIFLFYKILLFYFNEKFSLIFTFLFSMVPIFLYSTFQISSIILQIYLLLQYLYFVLKFHETKKTASLTFFSIVAGLLILIRGEFLLFYFITLTYFFLFYEFKPKLLLISLLISLIVISPYLQRNYSHFDSFILTKSFGYNLLKGNNPDTKVEGNPFFIEEMYNRASLKIKPDNYYEINLDDFYKKEAFNYISKDPLRYLKYYFFKIFSFIFVDFNSTYPNYYNVFHLFPKVIVSLIATVGGIISLRKKGTFQFLSIFYFCNILLFSIFFILPRYSLILLPVQLLLSAYFIDYLRRKLRY